MSTSDFSKLTVRELKNVLKRKGITIGNKCKQELLDVVISTKDKYPDLERCDHEESEKKRRRVQSSTGAWLDLCNKKIKWSNNLSTLPDLREGDAFAYFVTVCEWPPERLRNYKSQDGYRMSKEQHVENVEVGHHDEADSSDAAEFLYVRGKVKPEQRQSAQRYDTWLLLTSSGQVKSGGCQCVAADAGNCKHVICLLFSLADYNNRQLDKGTEVGTDKVCYWNQARRESKPVEVEQLDYRHDKSTTRTIPPTPDNFRPAHIQETDILKIRQKIQSLCQKVKPGALFLTAVDPPPRKPEIHSLGDLAKGYKSDSCKNDFVDFLKTSISEGEKKHMANVSQDTPEWQEARKGRLTASIAKDILTLKPTSAGKTIKDSVFQRKEGSHKNLEHGKTFEPVARQLYLDEASKTHKGLTVSETGFHLCDAFPFLGASPDGLVFCPCHGHRILEIKCTIKHESVFVCDIPKLDSAYHLQTINGSLTLKPSSEWYSQVQFQMGVTGVHSCDLVVHSHKGIAIIPVAWNVEYWKRLSKKAIEVFNSRILPLLMDES